MPANLDRRNDRSERVPLRMAVELGDGDFRDAFAADALNFSKGGLSMRAGCLPDVRSRLWCRFQCLPSGATVTAQGEVVWAHLDGEHSGEFGLAFVDLDPKTEWLIEEMIAEQAALTKRNDEPQAEPSAKIATLQLEGSPEPIEATLAQSEGGAAVFEQQLDLLSLGRGVLARAAGDDGRSGHIAGVELRMVGNVPMLAVTVAFDDKPAYGEFTFAGAEPAHDTEPDLAAPSAAEPSTGDDRLARVTVTEFAASPSSQARGDEPEVSAAQRQPAPKVSAAAAAHKGPAWSISPLDPASLPEVTAEPEAVVAPRPDVSRSFALERGGEPAIEDEGELDAELRAFSAPDLSPWLLALRARLMPVLARAFEVCGSALHRMLPVLRGASLTTGSVLRSVYQRQLAPQLGTARRVLVSQLGRRRTTTAPAGQKRASAPSSRRSTLLLAVLGAAALGLSVYAFAPARHADVVELQRKVVQDAPPVEAAPEAPAAESPQAAADPASQAALAPKPASAMPAPAAAPPSLAEAAPTSNAAVATAAGPAKQAARKLRFGASELRNAKRFSLRMTGRVQELQGTADKGGFTVVISGGLSLDRAGPISSSTKSVARAMVINKGDRAELSIRFADGRQPAYQVTADGNTVYISIED
ncbi:MAG: PilZ domain-containing protein [Polyangiales bacterium]